MKLNYVISTIEELEDYLDKNDDYGTFGLRGLSPYDIKQNYKVGDYMNPSYDLCDRRDCDFDEDAEQLIGTSALCITQYMDEDELKEVYENALGYANNHHNTDIVYLVHGDHSDYGEDPGEYILYNENCLQYVGAEIIAEVHIDTDNKKYESINSVYKEGTTIMNAYNIRKIISENDNIFFGLRCDDYQYTVNDICKNSHQLFQDPFFDDEDNLVYPEGEDIYAGFYDAGELDGTSALEVTESNVEEVLKEVKKTYYANYINLIGGEYAEGGNDIGEIVIANAKVYLTAKR